MNGGASVRIAGVACELPQRVMDVEALEAAGLLQSPAAQLRDSGFGRCMVSDVPASTLAERAVARVLQATATSPLDVRLLVTATALPISAIVPHEGATTMLDRLVNGLDLTRHGAARLQHALGLAGACAMGVTELGCIALMGAVRTAHALMEHEGWDAAVCVNADVLPAHLPREVLSSVMSDVACAVLLERGTRGHRLLHHAHMTKGFYWDAERCRHELLAAYYPTAKRLIANALSQCGLRLDDIACVLPNNVSRRSWEAMCDVLRLPMERVYTDNIARRGHAMGSDAFINLHDAVREGRVRRGDIALLFGFGLGAHWACSVVEI